MILFDLDGTLIDSAPAIHASVNHMLADLGAEPLGLAEVKSFVGNGIVVLTRRIIAARGLAQPLDDLVAHLLRHYDTDAEAMTTLYPGVPQALQELHRAGHRMGICSNKPEGPARHILTHFGLDGLFVTIIGGDTVGVTKPDPAPLLAAKAALGGGPAVFVGDSEVDADTAVRAAMPFILFTEGYRKSPVAALAHQAAFRDFADLPVLAARLLADQA